MAIRYIFSINPGRSGSAYLSRLFEYAQGCSSFHEPDPICNGHAMRRYLIGDDRLMKQMVKKKLSYIRETTEQGLTYVETNHCFIKGFGWLMADELPQSEIGVIVLKRDEDDIVKSLLRIRCTTLSNFGMDWIMTPVIKDPIVPPPSYVLPPKLLHRIRRCLYVPFEPRLHKKLGTPGPPTTPLPTRYECACLKWYIRELYARGERFRDQFPKITFYETSLEDLNTDANVNTMFDRFGLRARDEISRVIGSRVNEKEHVVN